MCNNKKDGYRQRNVRQFLQSAYKAHYLATSRESRRYAVAYSRFAGAACRHLATSRESKAHFGLPWVRPGTIAVNVTWMERGFNACQTHRIMYPLIKPVSSDVRHFNTFFAHFCLPGYAPGTIAVNGTWMERGLNAHQKHCSIYFYLQTFPRYSDWSKIATFSYPHCFNAPVRGGRWDNRSKCHTVGKRIQCL